MFLVKALCLICTGNKFPQSVKGFLHILCQIVIEIQCEENLTQQVPCLYHKFLVVGLGNTVKPSLLIGHRIDFCFTFPIFRYLCIGFFGKEICHTFLFRFGVEHIKGAEPMECLKDVQHTLAGFEKIFLIHIPDFKGLLQMPIIRCEHGNTGGGVVFVKLIQQMGGEISCLIHLAADMHSAITVVGGKIVNLFTHSFLPSILILT